MKTVCFFTLLCGLLAVNTFSAQCEDSSGDDFPLDAIAKQKIALDIKNATSDDYLIAVARAADVNIIVDTTPSTDSVPVTQTPLLTVQKDIWLGGAFFKFTKAEKMRTKRFGEKTFLFWQPPTNPVGTARHIVDEFFKVRRAMPTQPIEVKELMADHFGATEERDGKLLIAIHDVQMDGLPSPLREKLLLEIQARCFGAYGARPELFDRDTWKKGSLSIGSFLNQPTPYLYLSLPVSKLVSVSTPLGRIESLAGDTR